MLPTSYPTQSNLQLPPELWTLVSEFLEYEELIPLSTVNHLFFDLMMSKRHREVDLSKYPYDILWFWRNIEKLKSPDIAKRVRVLKLSPWATWDGIYAPEQQFQTGVPDPLKKGKISTSSQALSRRSLQKNLNFRRSVPLLKGKQLTLSQPASAISLLGRMSPEERELVVISAVTNLACVADLNIQWRRPLDPVAYHPCCPMLKILFPAISSTLRSLTLDIPSTILSQFNPSSFRFSSLQKLNIKFTVEQVPLLAHCPRVTINDPKNTLESLIPFLGGLSSTLNTLSIETLGHVALTTFFDTLGEFRHLTDLFLTMPLDLDHLPYPEGLNRLLLRHHSIRTLSLKNAYCCAGNTNVTRSVDSIRDWHEKCFRGVSSETLKVFRIDIRYPFLAGDALQLLQPLLQKVESLTIGTRLLFERATSVLNALRGTLLIFLSLSVDILDPKLIDLLAGVCPNLNRLTLNIIGIRFPGSKDNCTVSDFSDALSGRRNSQPYVATLYDSWSLYDLEIWKDDPYHIRRCTLQWEVMRAIARNVPSIKSFARGTRKANTREFQGSLLKLR